MSIIDNYNRFKRAWKITADSRLVDKQVRLALTEYGRKNLTGILSKLDLQTKALTKQTIERWRQANQVAIDVDNPQRHYLLSIYDDAMHDLHLKGAIRNRKMAVVGKPFRVVDKEGNTNTDLTDLLKMAWFKNVISLAHDSKFWGHSLIEISDPVRTGKLRFVSVRLIPRHHVCPEYGVLKVLYTDWPEKGIPYRDGDIANFCIEAGDSYDLGELNSVSKEAISKKFVMQFWDTFGEIFGMPIRTAKTASRDPKDLTKIETMLESMGSAAWGLFPEGTTIELIASKQTDAYQVYDKRIIRANSEISKAILGQTMTMDDGSSLSQAKVHETVADEIAEMDRDWVRDWVNDILFPFCIRHGWPLKGFEFDWDEAREYTVEEMVQIEDMILGHYDVDPEYFIDKYGIKIIGKKQAAQSESPQEPDDTKGKKPTANSQQPTAKKKSLTSPSPETFYD